MKVSKNDSVIKYPPVSLFDVLKEFWNASKRYRTLFLVIYFCIVIAEIGAVFTPQLYKQFFDQLSADPAAALAIPTLTHIIVIILGINFLTWIAYRIASLINAYVQPHVMAHLKERSFDYMIEHSYSFFSNNFTGSLVQRLNRFARAFENLDDRVKWNMLPLLVRIIGVSIALAFLDIRIALILLLGIAVFFTFNIVVSRWKLRYDLSVAEMDSVATGVLADSITNHATIQLFAGALHESRSFEKVALKQARITQKAWSINETLNSVQALILITTEFFLFYFGIRLWQAGTIGIGGFVLIQVYFAALGSRLWDFARIIRDLYQSLADAKEMLQILKLPHDIKNIRGAKRLHVEKGEVEFQDIHFSFNKARAVLDGITIKIQSGEKVALIGPSGAGKSTFVRLLFRLYEAQKGEILIDGQNITKVTHESLRENISLVPQDPILFHRTLMENIRYGRRDATDKQVIRAAELAHCDEFVKDLPQGYETYVGERGVKLSGGERQRVAIARAILKNAPVLILDEATSSLDSHSELLIQDALEKLMQGKTTIVIAHRLSTIRKMDRIIVIDHGQISEEGTHDDLVAREGSLYRKLWELQAGGFITENDTDPAPESPTGLPVE